MHSNIRVFATAFVCLALSGCEKPEVNACEAFIKSTLTLPSSYTRVKISSHDEAPMSRAKFYADAGMPDPANDESPTIRANAELMGNALGRRDLYITYEADGAQSIERCVFKVVNGEIQGADPASAEVSISSSNADSARLMDAGLLPEDGNSRRKIGFRCCVL